MKHTLTGSLGCSWDEGPSLNN